jgi:autotransporter-associated beta strand protein
LYLNGANTYTGNTIINAGVLAGTGSIAGSVVVTGGALGGGTPSAIGTLSVGGNVTFIGGGAFIRVNRSGLQCDKVSVGGTLTATAPGTITVTNLGPDLQPGDKFVLFPGKTVIGGSALTVTGAGMLWTNKLELDGSIEVLGVAPPPVNPNPTNISFSVSAGTLNLSWPASHTGWRLQVQTNALNVGISTNWVDVPGSESTNQIAFPINPTNGTVFFRLIYQRP